MLKIDKKNNTITETNKLIKHTDEQLEILTKLFTEWGILDAGHNKGIREIRDEKKEKYSE